MLQNFKENLSHTGICNGVQYQVIMLRNKQQIDTLVILFLLRVSNYMQHKAFLINDEKENIFGRLYIANAKIEINLNLVRNQSAV